MSPLQPLLLLSTVGLIYLYLCSDYFLIARLIFVSLIGLCADSIQPFWRQLPPKTLLARLQTMNLFASFVLCSLLQLSCSFVPSQKVWGQGNGVSAGGGEDSPTKLFFFDKMFEESGPLGKGITVGKVQVALMTSDRSPSSILGLLQRKAKNTGSTSYDLAKMAQEVCLDLLRKSDDWVAAHSESLWFKEDDAARAESQFNSWSNGEAVKFEKEYTPGPDSDDNAKPGGTTTVVVSLVIEIQGDTTKFDGAGFSLTGTKEVLQGIASDALIENGDCVNAVEVFWTPGDPSEVITSRDLIVDFPELVTL